MPESIERFVTEQLAAWEVPGCAIAAVRNGEVVLAAGWGRRHVAAGHRVLDELLGPGPLDPPARPTVR